MWSRLGALPHLVGSSHQRLFPLPEVLVERSCPVTFATGKAWACYLCCTCDYPSTGPRVSILMKSGGVSQQKVVVGSPSSAIGTWASVRTNKLFSNEQHSMLTYRGSNIGSEHSKVIPAFAFLFQVSYHIQDYVDRLFRHYRQESREEEHASSMGSSNGGNRSVLVCLRHIENRVCCL